MSETKDVPTDARQDAQMSETKVMIEPFAGKLIASVSPRDATTSLAGDVSTEPQVIQNDDGRLASRTPPEISESVEVVEPVDPSTRPLKDIGQPEPVKNDMDDVLFGQPVAPDHKVEQVVIEVAAGFAPQQKTTALKPYRTLQPADTENLVDTIQTIFEENQLVRESGVILLDAPHLIPADGDIQLPPPNYGFEATSQRVMTPAKLIGTGLVVIKHEEAVLKDQVPQFMPTKELSEDEMEAIFRESIEMHGRNSRRYPYFNIDISDFRVRPQGSFELTCGAPMDKLSYIAGVNTPYGYYSRGLSHFGAHVEDWHFASYNILFAGKVKLWVAVKPSSKKLFESKIRELFPEIGTCVQFVRHLAINIAPSTLRKWGVEHVFVPQRPGQVVAVSGYTYHWGINTGHNYAEAINFCMEKKWEAPEVFKNCYHGCGIADDMIPLPKPIWEDGDLKTKKERAIMRDQAFRREWDVEAKKLAQEQEIQSSNKKPKPRRQRESTARTQSESITFMPNHVGPPPPSRGDPAPVASPRRSQKPKFSNALQDSIEVSATAQRQTGRDYRRRTTTGRHGYRDVSSSPSEPSESMDDEPQVKRSRPTKAVHSRHPSGILDAPVQQDVSAVATQINGLKNTVLSFLIDQKKAASEANSKQEQLLRLQVDWQIKQTEYAQKQTEYAFQMMESQRRMEHLTMMMLQKLENQQVVPQKAPPSTNSVGQMKGHARFSQSVGGNIPPQGRNIHHVPNMSHLQIAFDGTPQGGPTIPHPRPETTSREALIANLSQPDKPSSASNATSRAPSAIGSSSLATEEDARTSPDSSSSTPHLKSMQSTPLADDIAPTSPPSSLSERGPYEDSIGMQEKSIGIQEGQTGGDDEADESSLSEVESLPEDEPEASASLGFSGAVVDESSLLGRSNKLKCMSCKSKRVTCDRESPCKNCIERNTPGACVYPKPKNRKRTTRKRQNKRAASEAVPAATQAPSAKRAKTAPEHDNVESVQKASQQTPATQSRAASPPVSKELLRLFNTKEFKVTN